MPEKISFYALLSKLFLPGRLSSQTIPPGWTEVCFTQHGKGSVTLSFNVEVSENEVSLNLRWVSKSRLNHSLSHTRAVFHSVAQLRSQLRRLSQRTRSPRRQLSTVPYGCCWLPHRPKERRGSFYLGSLTGRMRGRRVHYFSFAILPGRQPLSIACNAIFDKESASGWLPPDFFDKVLDSLPR